MVTHRFVLWRRRLTDVDLFTWPYQDAQAFLVLDEHFTASMEANRPQR